MLEGLDEIDWSSLSHAYGPAEDVPRLLWKLASEDAEDRKEAISTFYGNIYHQGTVYEASAYAAGFLISLLGEKAVLEKSEILNLLASLAGGASYHDVHGFWKGTEEENQEILRDELNWVRKTRQAVAKGAGTYLSLLEDEDAAVRHAVPYALASCVVRDTSAALTLMEKARVESNQEVRASMLMGIGALAAPGDDRCMDFLAAEMKSPAVIVRLCAALALRQVGGEQARENILPVALDAAGGAMEQATQMAWFVADREYLAEVGVRIGGTPAERFDFLAKLVERTSGKARGSVVWELAQYCRGHPEAGRLAAPMMPALLADESEDVQASALYVLEDSPEARSESLPALLDLYRRGNMKLRKRAAIEIGRFGDPSTLPVLREMAQKFNSASAIEAMGWMGAKAAGEAELLAEILNQVVKGEGYAFNNARIAAAVALGELGAGVAKVAVPALILALRNGNARRIVPGSLGKFGPFARSAEAALVRLIDEGDDYEKAVALLALWRIDAWPIAVTAREMCELFEKSQERDKRLVAGKLAELGVAAKSALPTLRVMVETGNEWDQRCAAFALWRIGGDMERALPIFEKHGVSRLDGREIACLGEMGPAVRHLLPALKAALVNGPSTFISGTDAPLKFRQAAARAIDAIEGSELAGSSGVEG